LLHTSRPSAVPVKFHNYNDGVTKVAGRSWVPTMHSRDNLLQAKVDHSDRVHSDQMVHKMIRQRRLVWQSRSSAEAKSLKLGLKVPSDYYSNEIAVKAARRESSWPNKRATLTEFLLKERELNNLTE
jgi:hypothetical protein